jgi:transcriptional regulator with XRE-family HTH domain
LTQQQVADRMAMSKGRVSQIERGKVSGQEVLAHHATALGGRLHQAIYFDPYGVPPRSVADGWSVRRKLGIFREGSGTSLASISTQRW